MKLLAILVCKFLRLVGGMVGRGSSLPGKYALKICPDILSQVTLPPCVIAVTGSNGKTSTVEMIATILQKSGKRVIYNKEGSNQIEGVTTLILGNATLDGTLDADVLLLESDERYAAHSFQYFHPTYFVITNLYRDQLTRNGHPEWVYDALLPAIHPDTTLVLNADDPLVASLAQNHKKVKWFGLNRATVSSSVYSGMYADGTCCPLCKSHMEYTCYHYNHIGHYRCPNCEYSRPATDYTATAVDLFLGRLVIDGTQEVELAFRSIYNVYNILAAYSVCDLAGVVPVVMVPVLNNYILKNGRMVHFNLGAHRGTLLISKHENSIAYDTNFRYISRTDVPCTVMVVVDAISRKYFTSDTSWLWDINFDLLKCNQVGRVILTGKYSNDLAQRVMYSSLKPEKVDVIPDIHTATSRLKSLGREDIYVVTCFSDREKVLADTEKEEEKDGN